MSLQTVFIKAFKQSFKQTLKCASEKIEVAFEPYSGCSSDRFISEILHVENFERKWEVIYDIFPYAIVLKFFERNDFLFVASRWGKYKVNENTKGMALGWPAIENETLRYSIILIDATNEHRETTLKHELRHIKNKLFLEEKDFRKVKKDFDRILEIAKDEILAYLSDPKKSLEKIQNVLSKRDGMYYYPGNTFLFPDLDDEKRQILWDKYTKELWKLFKIIAQVKYSQLEKVGIDFIDLLAVTPVKKWKYLPGFIELVFE